MADFKGVLGNNVLTSLLKDTKDQCLRSKADEKMRRTVCVVCGVWCAVCDVCVCVRSVCVCVNCR